MLPFHRSRRGLDAGHEGLRAQQERLLLDVVQFRQPGEPAVALGRLTIGPFDAPLPCSPVRVTVECRRDGTIALEAHDVCGRILPQTMARPWEQGAACLDAQRSLVRSTIINDRVLGAAVSPEPAIR